MTDEQFQALTRILTDLYASVIDLNSRLSIIEEDESHKVTGIFSREIEANLERLSATKENKQ